MGHAVGTVRPDLGMNVQDGHVQCSAAVHQTRGPPDQQAGFRNQAFPFQKVGLHVDQEQGGFHGTRESSTLNAAGGVSVDYAPLPAEYRSKSTDQSVE
jgi:hypothetical protein